jgi:hypothetical protein
MLGPRRERPPRQLHLRHRPRRRHADHGQHRCEGGTATSRSRDREAAGRLTTPRQLPFGACLSSVMDGVDLLGRLLDRVGRPGLLLDRPGEQPERRLGLVGQRLALDERLDVLERLTLARPPFDGRPEAGKVKLCQVWTSSPPLAGASATWCHSVRRRAFLSQQKSLRRPPRTRRTAASPSDVLVVPGARGSRTLGRGDQAPGCSGCWRSPRHRRRPDARVL